MDSHTRKYRPFLVTVYFILAVYLTAITGVHGASSNQVVADAFRELRANLTRRLQERFKIPPNYYTTRIPIYLSYEPLQIIMVDEIYQQISVSATATVWWLDPNIGWNPADYYGLETIQMSSALFWTPSVLVPKTTETEGITLQMPEYLYVAANGYVRAFIPAYTNTLCNLDMSEFPFDTHNCTIVFLEHSLYNLTSQILPYNNISTHFGTSAAWILNAYGCNQVTTHNVQPPFDYIVCYVKMSRRSTFFIVNLIGPMAMTSLMTLIVFWIPAEEGEKITFLVSMFMSTSVFLNYILDLIPRSMENIPRLNLLLYAIILQVILATAATAFVLRRYKQEQQQQGQQYQQQPSPKRCPLWPWQKRQNQNDQQSQKLKSSNGQRSAQERNHSFINKKNSVYPKQPITVRPIDYDGQNYNSHQRSMYVSAVTDKNEKGNVPAPEVFTVDNDIPRPPEYTPPQDGGNKGKDEGKRRYKHDELDRMFFCLMLLLTITVYLLAFLV